MTQVFDADSSYISVIKDVKARKTLLWKDLQELENHKQLLIFIYELLASGKKVYYLLVKKKWLH